ncbi:hypothetical protein MYU51_003065 [Penicillium brevicompactum]|uniref:uncharacterized protein n=1 Tax=Penicillium brevicompactum TaxID=5074 RepID=UPI0025418011|nr:uncharacterized protein N7506_002727 [Penicillium brevicompactum]KAJ5344362.1 hypothetical protein N7506_002727 [Penicillium brevicompactum]
MSSELVDSGFVSSEEQTIALLGEIQDWQINHGSLLKNVKSQSEHSVYSYPVGVSVYPSPFPQSEFRRAMEIQLIYNELYTAIASNEDWLYHVTNEMVSSHPLANALWAIHRQTKAAGAAQEISAAIFRSDYMLHMSNKPSSSNDCIEPTLKQVEFNTFSCAGASHAKRVADMHRYMTRTGAYDLETATGQHNPNALSLPSNDNIDSLASLLASAHAAYGAPKNDTAKRTALLYIVQPYNFNIADERPIEYALWNRDPPVPTYRLNWGDDILQHTSLTDTQELLFHPPGLPVRDPMEISVVYMRAGYEGHEYDDIGQQARLRLEMSSAIKCPSILSHIATFKKVQQALIAPGELERFLTPEKAAVIRKTFVMQYPLDKTTEGLFARQIVHDGDCSNYILKPSLEGGGNNIYDRIPEFLESTPTAAWASYIMMERIQPPKSRNVLMGPSGVEEGPVVSELGIYGACLWKQTNQQSEMLHNSCAGWSFKTKHAHIDEMSVVKGYGCFDTPCLQ